MRMLHRGAAPTLIGETKKQFLQLMQDDVGQEIALLRSLQEYQVAEAGAVVAGEKLGEARQAGKQGLNKGASTLANTTQKVHQETLGTVAQTETFKKVEDVVVEKVVGFEKKQVYFFREAMPEEMLKEQKVLREKFVDKHRQEKEANTQEQGLVVVNAQKAQVRHWYNTAMNALGVFKRRECVSRIMHHYPQFTEHKLLTDYQLYLLPEFMNAVWTVDEAKLQKMCTSASWQLQVRPYIAQMEGLERECNLLQVETPMFVSAELVDPEDLMVDDEDLGDEDDDFDDFEGETKKSKKKVKKKNGKAQEEEDEEADGKKENFFEGEDFVNYEVRKLPVITLAAATQVYECYKDPKSGKVVHGDAEVAGVMGHMWRLAMLPTGEWVIADISFGSRSAME
jgi:hypothetical protein